MKKFNQIIIFFAVVIAARASATDLSGVMSHLDSEHNRDVAANMSHSHNADGSKRGKTEGQAISRSHRSTPNSKTDNSVHLIRKPHQLHKTHKLHERGSYAETCFTGDTLVTVSKEKSTELVPIKDVQPGDFVSSCKLEGTRTRGCTARKVLAKSENFVEELLSIGLDHGEIKTTFEHKFYVVDEGWVPAEELQIGYQLLSESGEIVFIKSIDTVDNIEDSVAVYDLKVEAEEDDDHNYYAGSDRVLVHNCDISIAGMATSAATMAGGSTAVSGTVVRGWMTQVAGAGVGLGMMNSAGRQGKQERLKELADDDKLGSADTGWLSQELNHIERGGRGEKKIKTLRNPPGKDLAHERGREAAKGYGYEYSNLQNRKDHKTQHKYDNNGKKNKPRPPKK